MDNMSVERRDECLRVAEVIDAYRIFPRMFLIIFVVAYCWLVAESWMWYTSLEYDKIDWAHLSALTAFPVGLLGALGGMLTSVYKNYQESGRDWNAKSNQESIKS